MPEDEADALELEAAAGALDDAAGALDDAGGGLELDGLDEHPAISAAAAAIVTPPAAMRVRLSLGFRTAAFAADREPMSSAMCVAPLHSRTVPKKYFCQAPLR